MNANQLTTYTKEDFLNALEIVTQKKQLKTNPARVVWLELSGTSTNIEDRIILLLRMISDKSWPTGGHGFWERLGKLTNTASKRWRNVYARDQRVTSDMLESLAKMFPQYAFWLVTGITGAVNGHIASNNAFDSPDISQKESA